MNLDQVAAGASPEVIANENFAAMKAAGAFGERASTTTGLTWGYYGVDTYNGNAAIPNGTVALTDNATNYVVVLRSTGAVSVSTATTHSVDPLYARIRKLTTASGVVTANVDERLETNGLLLGASVSGGGGLLASNNLSDVASAPTSRTNLGIGTVATLASDTDGTLAANSDTRIATQKAVKTYVDNAVTGLWDVKGGQDCSANPNYPAALKGDAYVVTVAGKIGGASGTSVDIGDTFVAFADNAGGTEASVGSSWIHIEHNLSGVALLASPAFTGNPTAPTALPGDNDTSIATTAFVAAAVAAVGSGDTELRGLTFTSDTGSTADADSSAGFAWWNNGTQASATTLFFDNLTADGVSTTTFFAALGSSGFIYLQQSDDATKWQMWKWTAVTAGSGYYKFTVSLMASGGSIVDNKTIYVQFNGAGSASAGGGNVNKIIQASYARPNDTTAYTVGDVVADSTSAATALSFASMAAANAGGGLIQSLTIFSSANQTQKLECELILFDTSPTMQNDNGAWSPSDSDLVKSVGRIYIPASLWLAGNTASGASGNAYCTVPNVALPFQCAAGSTTLYGVLVNRVFGYTPVALEVLTIRLGVIQDS